jgi:hypothetical protein
MNHERSDQRVDELLADLDRALAIEPSPAVAARVRTRVETGASGWFGWRWSLAAAGVIVLAGAAYLAWPRPSVAPPPDSSRIAASASATPGSQPSAQAPAQAAVRGAEPAMRHAGARTAAPTPVRHTTVEIREPEVLVSPNQRIALEQLAAALKDGRLTTESMAAASRPIVHEPLVVPSLVIEPFKADVLPAIGTSESVGSGGGVIRRVVGVVAH